MITYKPYISGEFPGCAWIFIGAEKKDNRGANQEGRGRIFLEEFIGTAETQVKHAENNLGIVSACFLRQPAFPR
jgi:hypothetical protein